MENASEYLARQLEWDWYKDPTLASYATSKAMVNVFKCVYSGSSDVKVQAMNMCDTVTDNCTIVALYNGKKCNEVTLHEENARSELQANFKISFQG
jgi:hypothetical protein